MGTTDTSATWAADPPPEIVDLLERLGIDRDVPWIWATTDGPITPEHARWQINGFFPEQHIPFDPDLTGAFTNFSLELLGVVLKEDDPRYGLLYSLTDQPLDIRFMRTRWQRSVLYAEFTATRRERDASIHGAYRTPSAKDREQAWAAMDLIIKGLQRGAPKGKRGPRDSERREWWLLAQEIGWKAARAKHKKAGGTWAEWKPIQRHK